MTGSYDPELNLLIGEPGNPGPDWNGDVRAGDNLFSDCLLALDPDNGVLKWYFQFTPHDTYDWDAAQVPVLVDKTVHGARRKLVVCANRNGFYYVLDRESGKFLAGKPLVYQNWAGGLDEKGRPVRLPTAFPTAEGALVYPRSEGATNWFSPSYDPDSNLFYVAVREHEGGILYLGDADFQPGAKFCFCGGGYRNVPREESFGAIRALEPATGEVRWEFKLFSAPWQGVLSTGGGLVFGGTNEGDFFALDRETGKALWHFQTGAQIWGNPMSYMAGGKQHVAIAAGAAIFDFVLGN